MGLTELTDEEMDKLSEAFVRAIAIGAPIHRDKNGKGPQHCPVVIWEDAVFLDWDCLPNKNDNL